MSPKPNKGLKVKKSSHSLYLIKRVSLPLTIGKMPETMTKADYRETRAGQQTMMTW